MSKNKKPKSETKKATHNKIMATRNKIIATRANSIIKVAGLMKENKLHKLTDDQIEQFVGDAYTLLRDLGCHVSITCPQEVVDEAECQDIKLTIEQAKQVCQNLQNNDWLGEQYCTTLIELIEDQYDEAKKHWELMCKNPKKNHEEN